VALACEREMACATFMTSRRRGRVGGDRAKRRPPVGMGAHAELAAWAHYGRNGVTRHGAVETVTRCSRNGEQGDRAGTTRRRDMISLGAETWARGWHGAEPFSRWAVGQLCNQAPLHRWARPDTDSMKFSNYSKAFPNASNSKIHNTTFLNFKNFQILNRTNLLFWPNFQITLDLEL
jgi:hypothetical protein